MLLGMCGCSSLRKVALQPIKIEGVAMLPGLKDGDLLFMSRDIDPIERGDIVIFHYPADQTKSYIKRVVGLPNDRLELRQGQLFINGEAVREPYVDSKNNLSPRNREEILIPQDNYYVAGDIRYHSNDSRSWGPLPRHFIYGKVEKVYSTR